MTLPPSGIESATLSVVVPCYNEDAVIALTHNRLLATLAALPLRDFEIIYVDDGSTDATLLKLRELTSADRRIRVLSLSRNFGHAYAVSAGIDAADGDAVVLIDADLQDPPELIESFLGAWQAGAKVVYGVRITRRGDSALKRGTAAIFYRMLNRMSDVWIPLDAGDFRLIDKDVVSILRKMPETDRFVRGLVAWIGFTQIAVPYERAPRAAGATKYPFAKMLRFAVSGILSFSSAPLRLATWLGFLAAMISVAGIFWALYQRLVMQDTVPGWAATFIAVLFLSGVQLITIGIIGEYVARIFIQSKRRPNYIIAETIGTSVALRASAE